MKNRIPLVLLLFASILSRALAQTRQPMAPNMYQLTGGHLHVTYSTTSINGQPHLNYQDGSQTLSFIGNQIRQTETDIGTLVSVTVRMTVDTGSTEFSLLVPAVNLTDPSSPAIIHTYGITTVHRFSTVAAANHGQVENYTTTELSGNASLVFF